MIQVDMLPNELAPDVLAQASHFAGLELAMSGCHNIQTLAMAIFRGDKQLWTISDEGKLLAILITTISRFPLKKVCYIEAICGTGMNRWVKEITTIEAWAKGLDCAEVKIIGREGWTRMLPEYTQEKVVLVKKLYDA